MLNRSEQRPRSLYVGASLFALLTPVRRFELVLFTKMLNGSVGRVRPKRDRNFGLCPAVDVTDTRTSANLTTWGVRSRPFIAHFLAALDVSKAAKVLAFPS
jgi:hypothetical protein